MWLARRKWKKIVVTSFTSRHFFTFIFITHLATSWRLRFRFGGCHGFCPQQPIVIFLKTHMTWDGDVMCVSCWYGVNFTSRQRAEWVTTPKHNMNVLLFSQQSTCWWVSQGTFIAFYRRNKYTKISNHNLLTLKWTCFAHFQLYTFILGVQDLFKINFAWVTVQKAALFIFNWPCMQPLCLFSACNSAVMPVSLWHPQIG